MFGPTVTCVMVGPIRPYSPIVTQALIGNRYPW
jgi:hypothetical protein